MTPEQKTIIADFAEKHVTPAQESWLEPFAVNGKPTRHPPQELNLAKAIEEKRAAHATPADAELAADAVDTASTEYQALVSANLAANQAMQTRLTEVFGGLIGKAGTMAGFQSFIVTQFVTFANSGDMTGGCSARADVPITACQHEGLNDKVRTLEIKIGIFLIYVALALNLFMLTVGQVCADEVSRLRWLSKATYNFMAIMQNWVFTTLQLLSTMAFMASMCLFLRGVEGIGDYRDCLTGIYSVVGGFILVLTVWLRIWRGDTDKRWSGLKNNT